MKPTSQKVVTVAGFVLLAAVGFVYLSSGLVVPTPALFFVYALWFVFVAVAIYLRRRPLWVLGLPFIALATLVLIVTLGDLLLGWTA